MQPEQAGRREALGDAAKVILASVGAFYDNDHVVLTSGRHSAAYVNHDPLFLDRHTAELSQLAGLLASLIIEVVRPERIPGALVGPMTGGWHLSHWTGHHYRLLKDSAPSVCAEKGENGTFRFEPRDRLILEGTRCLIIDDVLTTGKSARATKVAIEEAGGIVDGLLVVCDRSGRPAHELGFPNVWSLFSLEVPTYAEEECPLCKAGERVNTVVGHGAEFMLRKSQRAT
jgi:orotate phosphoribosyltransferase